MALSQIDQELLKALNPLRDHYSGLKKLIPDIKKGIFPKDKEADAFFDEYTQYKNDPHAIALLRIFYIFRNNPDIYSDDRNQSLIKLARQCAKQSSPELDPENHKRTSRSR